LPFAGHMASLLGWLHSLPGEFSQIFHSPHLYNILGSSLQLRLDPHSFPHYPVTTACRDPNLPFFWNLGGRFYNAITFSFCMPASQHHLDVTKVYHSLEQCPAPFDHGCSGLWLPRWMNSRKHFPM
jgi:hypothetical protein